MDAALEDKKQGDEKQSLFKIQDDNYTTTYCIDNRELEEDVLNNFFCAVAGHGYAGVKFEEVFER